MITPIVVVVVKYLYRLTEEVLRTLYYEDFVLRMAREDFISSITVCPS